MVEMEIIALFLLLIGLLSFLPRLGLRNPANQRKPKYKQYDESRHEDYFMKKVNEIYDLKKIRTEEEVNDDETEDDDEYVDEYVYEETQPAPAWQPQQNEYDSFDLQELEDRSQFYKHASIILAILAVIWYFGFEFLVNKVDEVRDSLINYPEISLIINITPLLLIIASRIFNFLRRGEVSNLQRILGFIEGIVIIFFTIGYIIDQFSKLASN
jgi:amino acid transporter